MNITKLLFPILMIGLFSCSKDDPIVIIDPTDPDPSVEASALSASMEEFSWNLFAKVLEEEDDNKNIIVSPLSVAAALYMTYNGADGGTRTAMSNALALNDMTIDTLNAAFETLSNLLQQTSGNTDLKIANAVFWDQSRITPADNFLSAIEGSYQAETSAADFRNNPDQVLTNINDWVSNKTEGRIEKILEELNPEEIMFLVNALYFIGDWDQPFADEITSEQDFKLSNGSTIKVPTMFQDNQLRFLMNEEISAVELDFDDTNYAMQFVLPASDQKITDWLDGERLNDINQSIADEATKGRVMVSLPKFEIDYKIKLNEVLKSLGMEIAFDMGAADFSNLGTLSSGNAYISRVEHKTYLKIDEKGAEGAAVTAVGVGATSLPPSIQFNRPFLLQLLHKPSNTIVFTGVIQNPVAEN